MSFQQGQAPPQQGGQRTGFSALPQGAQQALTGVLGVVIVAAIVFGFSFFLSTTTGKVLFFESTKTLTFALLLLGIVAYAFMWIKVSIATNPTVFELAVPAVGLAIYYAAVLIFSYVWAFVVSGSAAVINMTLN